MMKAVFLLCFYMYIYYIVGFGVKKLVGDTSKKDGFVVIGMFTYFVIFFVFVLPMKFLQVKLSHISWMWVVLIILLTTGILFKNYKEIHRNIRYKWSCWSEDRIIYILTIGLVALQLFCVEKHGIVGSPWDASFYIGEVSTALHDNMLGVSSAYTGIHAEYFDWIYMLETYLAHSAVMCKFFNVAPLIEVRTVMTAIVIILFNLVVREIGKELFEENREKLFIFWCTIVYIWFMTTMYTPGGFLLNRTFECKTILANIVLPALFLFFLRLYKNKGNEKADWIYLFLVICGSYTFSLSAMFIVPVALVGYFPIILLKNRSRKVLSRMIVCLLPCVLILLYYLLMSRGVFMFEINQELL